MLGVARPLEGRLTGIRGNGLSIVRILMPNEKEKFSFKLDAESRGYTIPLAQGICSLLMCEKYGSGMYMANRRAENRRPGNDMSKSGNTEFEMTEECRWNDHYKCKSCALCKLSYQ